MWTALASLLIALGRLLVESLLERRRLTQEERDLAEDAHDRATEGVKLRLQQARKEIENERKRVRETYEAARRRRNPGD